jgi:hypothetical protein
MTVQVYRLWPRLPPDGTLPIGLSCDDEGLLLAGNCRLIVACLDGDGRKFYRARTVGELNVILSAAYGERVDATSLHPALVQIAKCMTERNWTQATLSALHLRLPELADEAAATRALKADALLKVTASFEPDKHPRWPKGSQAGHGGEFRPRNGDLLVPVGDPRSDLDSSRVQIHYHHWHDRAITAEYEKRGLLTPEAYDYLMNNPQAKSPPIYQDIRNPDYRVHMFDTLHRAASEEVRHISEEYLKANRISATRPMTEGQAIQLVQEIITSQTPALKAYRKSLLEYQEGRGSEAEAARARFLERVKNTEAE